MIARADCSGDGEVTEEDQGSAALSVSIKFAVNNIPVRLHASAFLFFVRLLLVQDFYVLMTQKTFPY